jgi:hypothetical protein
MNTMTDEVHSCSLFCDRPACIKAQRDQMRFAADMPDTTPTVVAHPLGALEIRSTERLLVAAELLARAKRMRARGHAMRADTLESAALALRGSARKLLDLPKATP